MVTKCNGTCLINTDKINLLFDTLWEQYILLAPSALKIRNMFAKTQNKKIINDHIALRTINNEICNIEVLSKTFIELGYSKKENFNFENKHLNAYCFRHKNDIYPSIFISELKLNEMSDYTRNILSSSILDIPTNILNSNNIVSSGKHWSISYEVYNKLYKESEYAAWFYVFGFVANHFTISINHLEQFDTIEQVNNHLKQNNYKLNTAGGEIKGSKKVLLEQSSTLAEKVNVLFSDGEYKIPSCFYEFIKRHKNKEGVLYNSFITKSADKIFESTN